VIQVEDILISVEDRYARNMLGGSKTVELRRRALRISPGTRIWVYTKLPKGKVELVAVVDKIESDFPANLWARYGTNVAISLGEFESYFANVRIGYAIIFRDVIPVSPGVELDTLRRAYSAFNPPQFFKRLAKDSPELALLRQSDGRRQDKIG